MEKHSFDEEATICVRTLPVPPITGWHSGDDCRIDGGAIGRTPGRMYEARILTLAHVNGVQMAELSITASVMGFDGQPITQTWIHPKFVPTSKLRKAYLQ